MTRQTSATQFARNVSWSVVLAGVGAVAAFASQTVIARSFGVDALGVSAYAMGWANLLHVWTSWGLTSTIARFAPAYAEQADRRDLQNLMRFTYSVVTAIALLLAIAIFLARGTAALLYVSSNRPILILVLIISTTGLDLNGCALTYTGHAVKSQFVQGVLRPLSALTAALLWPFFLPKALDSAVIIVTASVVLAFVVSTIMCVRTFGISTSFSIGARPQWSTWLRYSTPYIISATAVSLISTQLDTIVVGTLLTQRDAGVYAVGASLANLVHLAPQAVERILAPRFNAAVDLGSQSTQVARLSDLMTANAALTLCSFIVVALISKPLLSLFGKDFSQAVLISVILSAGVLFSRTGGVGPSTVLQAMGFQQRAAMLNIIVAGFAAVASIIMTKYLGLIGTACATVIAGIARALMLSIAQHRAVSIRVGWQDVIASVKRSGRQLRVS